ncbi:hypothetical protein [Streptomyces fuscigenes]|uniref:hypothetical protein n=1 Tax=Streptomyces fuscigenes TaxID=1528880 RepID=UPI001F19C0CD|nr:hypothetical protein [Streptomyces fuscigenes]MCF3960243.1 hypothetical protein [Streptomyces fuscigenes]
MSREDGCRLALRRTADLCPGEAKTDAKAAAGIADAARTMPHTLRWPTTTLRMGIVLAGFRRITHA